MKLKHMVHTPFWLAILMDTMQNPLAGVIRICSLRERLLGAAEALYLCGRIETRY